MSSCGEPMAEETRANVAVARPWYPPRKLALLARPVVLGFILAATILSWAGHTIALNSRFNQVDFSHYYASALALRKGLDPYTTHLETIAQPLGLNLRENTRATYPPTFLLCFEPLTRLSPYAAYWTWIGFTTLCLALALYVLLTVEVHLEGRLKWLVVALALLYQPVWHHYKFAQSQILILLLIVIMMRALARGRDSLAGFSLAAATALRVFPVILAGYLICRRRWRALGWTVTWGAVIGALTLLMFGTASFDFVKAIPFIESSKFLVHELDYSLAGFISRLFSYSMGSRLTPGVELARRITELAAELGMLAIAARASLRARNDAPETKSDDDWRTLSLWIATMIIITPTAWEHYLVLMLIPFLLIAGAASRGTASSRTVWAVIVAWLMWPLQRFLYVLLLVLIPVQFRLVPFRVLVEFGMVAQALGFLAVYWFLTDWTPERAIQSYPQTLGAQVDRRTAEA